MTPAPRFANLSVVQAKSGSESVEDITVTKMSGCGPDAHQGWYSISLGEVRGLQSGESNLRIRLPVRLAQLLAQNILRHLPSGEV
jgi:hypothetical protein